MAEKKQLLTKNAFLLGLQCDKLLWMYQNQRELMPEVDETTQAIFRQGHRVGDLAKTLYPDGIEIDWNARLLGKEIDAELEDPRWDVTAV